ncbi:MAG: hypothetical protein Q9169_002830 [Polycauliona sp. 2 TL-2023]
MYPQSILAALVGALAAFATAHDESTALECTTTATVSVTTPMALPIAARSTSAPALPVTSATGPLDILTGSAFDSAISALASSFPSGANFGTVTGSDTTYSLTASPITNPSDLTSRPTTRSTVFLGPNTTLNSTSSASKSTSTTSTKTSTASASETTTAAAGAMTSPAAASEATGGPMPVTGANLALAVVAGVMFLL